jgi:DNA-binding CsgD family transcriptional regulator
MDTARGVLEIVGALRGALHRDVHVFADLAVEEALFKAFPADYANLTNIDVRARQFVVVPLFRHDLNIAPTVGVFWETFWDAISCSYTERVPSLRADVTMTEDFYSDRQWHSTGMYTDLIRPIGWDKELVIPVPGPPGVARRLVFMRGPRERFSDAERDAAVLLQPFIFMGLRTQARQAAAKLLTSRQQELLWLVAAGHDNRTIARMLGISPETVRKHLENAFARLGVSSRTAAVAKVCPDLAWR